MTHRLLLDVSGYRARSATDSLSVRPASADIHGMEPTKQVARTALMTLLVLAVLGIAALGAQGLLTGFGNLGRGSDLLHGIAFQDIALGSLLLVLASALAYGA